MDRATIRISPITTTMEMGMLTITTIDRLHHIRMGMLQHIRMGMLQHIRMGMLHQVMGSRGESVVVVVGSNDL